MTEVQVLIVGVVISIINLIFFLYNFYVDRGIIRFNPIFLTDKTHTNESLCIYITNVGRRALYLRSVGYIKSDLENKSLFVLKECNKELNENKEILLASKIVIRDKEEVGILFAVDYKGKVWMASKKVMKNYFDMALDRTKIDRSKDFDLSDMESKMKKNKNNYRKYKKKIKKNKNIRIETSILPKL